jgi:hypothetical protein
MEDMMGRWLTFTWLNRNQLYSDRVRRPTLFPTSATLSILVHTQQRNLGVNSPATGREGTGHGAIRAVSEHDRVATPKEILEFSIGAEWTWP